ncbi:MAG TPA: NAD(P)H-hydrate dehydratase, partial [Polyangiaceae bacterium]|nr:NAD(P)H-hydrate dehydratase [Polyangiaceae bacterium]
MRPVLSAEQMRAFDQHHIEAGVSGSILMENAGRGAAHLIGLKLRPREPSSAPRIGSNVVGSCVRCADERSLFGARVLVLAGAGNNGGDGLVVARHLAARAADVRVLLSVAPEQVSGTARVALDALCAVGVHPQHLLRADYEAAISEADVVVDALLGTGAERAITGALREVIDTLNAAHKYVIALDIPSGLHATRGGELGVTVRANHTVTFAHLKTGLLTNLGHKYAGSITLSHIGVPSALPAHIEPSAWLIEESDVRARLKPRLSSGHKGQAGHVVVAAGSVGTLGAARLASRAALRGGAGLVTIVNDAQAIALLQSEVAEVMTQVFDVDAPAPLQPQVLERADACIVGPGLGQSPLAHALFERVLSARRPTVVDADALRYLAADGRQVWQRLSPGAFCVLTPHPGEAAALLGVSSAEVEQDRFLAVERLASEFGACVLLKGSRPLLKAPGRAPVVSAFGSPALSTAGSGD